ncbi:hypothetical protein [Methanolobus sp. ZRKC5]|uniref:hypothetical protein n=1 Tax=unclassified Methanolobus TaxID=2629569 RepID=UPI00313BD27B
MQQKSGDKNMIWAFSALKEEEVKSIKELEDKMNVTLLSFSGIDISNAELSKSDLEEIQTLEEKLGRSLVAVKVKSE